MKKKQLTRLTRKRGVPKKRAGARKADRTSRPTPLAWQVTFLEELENHGVASVAAEVAGISRQAAYKAAKKDPDFKMTWDYAIEVSADRMELEARRRAVDGTDRPVFHQGKVCGHVREYSDQLLTFLLRAHRPQKYRERTAVIANFDPTKLTDDQLQRIVAGEDPLVVLATSAPGAA